MSGKNYGKMAQTKDKKFFAAGIKKEPGFLQRKNVEILIKLAIVVSS